MKENEPEKQQAVRPGFLIIALLGLGGVLYWNFFMQPKKPPPSNIINNTAQPIISGTTPPINNSNVGGQPEQKQDALFKETVSNRDLFLPPSSVITARRKKKDTSSYTNNQSVWNEPRLIKPGQEITALERTDENPEKPVWKGVLGTTAAQVIIIRYQNKSYLLKLGDLLPGTKYRVTEINDNAVILVSPKDRLKLEKKERANNG